MSQGQYGHKSKTLHSPAAGVGYLFTRSLCDMVGQLQVGLCLKIDQWVVFTLRFKFFNYYYYLIKQMDSLINQ